MNDTRLISLSALARRLDISAPRVHQLYDAGILKADFESNAEHLFLVERIPELRAAVKDFGIDRAIKANAARQRTHPVTNKDLIIK